MLLRLTAFKGANRALHPRLLPPGIGAVSINQKPGRGDLRPWNAPASVASVPAGRQTIYRMGRDVQSESSYWLSWPTVVHAVRGFDTDDQSERTYYTGDGPPKVTDNTMALAGTPYPMAHRPLAVPAPTAPAIISPTGSGSAEVGTYSYVYTFVNDWGWESAPSPVSNYLDLPSDQPISVTGFSAPPSGNYNVQTIRVYRTEAASSGADFFFVVQLPVGTASYVDDKNSIQEVLPTKTWTPPPADLHYLRPLWNGMLAGISGNGVRFCEPYTPYAWPIAYDMVPPDSKPVALGVFDQNLVVLTTGRPILVAGSGPEAMDQRMIEMSQACVAPRSVVGMGYGVVWASADGLCLYGSGGPKILSAGVLTREDWQALKPETIVGQQYEGLYFGSYDDGAGRKGFFVDPSSSTFYFLSTGYQAMHFDELLDQLYVLVGDSVCKWDAGAAMTARFRTGATRLPRPQAPFAAAEVVADAYPLTVRFFADGSLRHTEAVTSADPFRLPGGFQAQEWEVEVETQHPVQAVAMAHSVEELKQA